MNPIEIKSHSFIFLGFTRGHNLTQKRNIKLNAHVTVTKFCFVGKECLLSFLFSLKNPENSSTIHYPSGIFGWMENDKGELFVDGRLKEGIQVKSLKVIPQYCIAHLYCP